uniref:Uncharacterized protein n=1 Tax=Vespula pensylvanica TaxID=30213 RepID=A0A834UBK3_VESPE|nr:hypothetical protein H0235_005759 [Vespula pensylvanica]
MLRTSKTPILITTNNDPTVLSIAPISGCRGQYNVAQAFALETPRKLMGAFTKHNIQGSGRKREILKILNDDNDDNDDDEVEKKKEEDELEEGERGGGDGGDIKTESAGHALHVNLGTQGKLKGGCRGSSPV